jgi:hypothetical protein
MNLVAKFEKLTASPQQPDYVDARFQVSGPGITGTMDLVYDNTTVELDKDNSRIGTDLFTLIQTEEEIADAKTFAAAEAKIREAEAIEAQRQASELEATKKAETEAAAKLAADQAAEIERLTKMNAELLAAAATFQNAPADPSLTAATPQ